MNKTEQKVIRVEYDKLMKRIDKEIEDAQNLSLNIEKAKDELQQRYGRINLLGEQKMEYESRLGISSSDNGKVDDEVVKDAIGVPDPEHLSEDENSTT